MLRYRAGVSVEELAENECTVRPTRSDKARWWQLWFCVRTTLGTVQHFAVPVNPGGPYIEQGHDGRRTWGLKREEKKGPGSWQISPSINATYKKTVNGKKIEVELWHKTPLITDVPESEPWTTSAVPT